MKALEIVESEPDRRQRIYENSKYFRGEMKKLGFDPSKSQDPVYFLNGDKYEEINEELYKSIQSGNVRF
jgi:7-keto-8-aminopelargonate synthetase-like enzyme